MLVWRRPYGRRPRRPGAARAPARHRAGAAALFERILPILAFSNQQLDISIRFFKRLLWRQGLYPTPNVREPLEPFDSYHIRIADELIERAIVIEASL